MKEMLGREMPGNLIVKTKIFHLTDFVMWHPNLKNVSHGLSTMFQACNVWGKWDCLNEFVRAILTGNTSQ